MPVQFILGEHPQVKRQQMINWMRTHLNENPTERLIYLVPDNVKYEAETTILNQFMREENSQYSGMMRLQVFSFSRLAWYLLQNKPIYQRPQLTETGLGMLIKDILQQEEENLTIFKGASQQTGFITRLVKLFLEFRNGKVTPSDLLIMENNERLESKINQEDFTRKMSDIAILYQKYDERLSDKFLEKEDLFSELIAYIKDQKSLFENTTIIVDHYEHFSAQELELLIQFAHFSKDLKICLTINEKIALENNHFSNPFYRSTKTFQQLTYIFQENQLKIKPYQVIGTFLESLNGSNHEVLELAEYWINSSLPMTYMDLEKYKKQSYNNLEVWAAEDKKAELMHIATKIRRLVANGNYRYKDFQIMTRDLESYALNIHAVFDENEIPYFIDQAETMSEHPLLELIVSLFSLKKRNYRLEDIIRFLRTELYCPDLLDDKIAVQDLSTMEVKNGYFKNVLATWRNKVDIAENVALAYGYQGKDWTKDEEWLYARLDLEGEYAQNEAELNIQSTANEVRETFRTEIVPFIEELSTKNTNREIITRLYQFLSKIGVVEQIKHWRDQLIASGELEEARKHEQAWDTFINLLDEFVEVLGEENWDIDLFLSIIETGFEQATFSMVPPTLDQVLVTNFDLPKIETKNIVFLIGLTDTHFPKAPTSQSLLTDEDRVLVEAQLSTEKYLATSEMESSANEPFMMYLAMLQANEKIYFTFPMANEESKENRISPFLSRISKALSLRTYVKYANASSHIENNLSGHLDYVGTNAQTFGQLITSLRHALDERKQPETYWAKLFEVIYNPSDKQQRRIVNSLSHKNIPVPLPDTLAHELYGKDLYLSVSQLETFYADPFSHFLIYGLRLKERRVQELSPLETGNFFHDALDIISNQIFKANKDLTQLTQENLKQITTEVFEFLTKSNKYRLSQSSKRMQFIFKQLSKTVERMVWSIVNQANRSELRTSKTELLFGRIGADKGVQGLSFPLKSGGQLHLRGKVDRVDTVKIDGQLYTGIVDYKSSMTKFDYQKMYYGLMMQMLTYLDTVLSNSVEIFNENAKGLGAFYSRVHNPYIDAKTLKQKEIEDELLKNYKFDGLIIDNPSILRVADTELEGGFSPLYPFRLLKSGAYSGKNILTEEEFALLLRFNRDKIIEAGNRILAGENMLRPLDDANIFTPSVRGSYQAISQFDALLPENNYHEMLSLDKENFFKLLNDLYNVEPKEENE